MIFERENNNKNWTERRKKREKGDRISSERGSTICKRGTRKPPGAKESDPVNKYN